MSSTPQQRKPALDNLSMEFLDQLLPENSTAWAVSVQKRLAQLKAILVFSGVQFYWALGVEGG